MSSNVPARERGKARRDEQTAAAHKGEARQRPAGADACGAQDKLCQQATSANAVHLAPTGAALPYRNLNRPS